jgi:hypothetical protein
MSWDLSWSRAVDSSDTSVVKAPPRASMTSATRVGSRPTTASSATRPISDGGRLSITK